ncbi:hypothetical protein M231_07713 [Tremella mesenterica]|uniref:DNA repair protein RAD50 n=1 Tax=Tremella mesenterica TaxID=5217 RepID=A0A4Q1BDR6_TREME|nr:hypothetical protein M231_07713 [Tremella mesenterica]
MASLNKLAIRGIRSFDDKHVQVIEFYSPLTVIVGHNGSGKTTIIECLKYATTGEMPPNTKGGAFIHDPKMANEKEVKAQVRLRFWNVNRQRMTATRNVQVTVKKTGGLTMKTLEGILAKTDENGGEGKRNTISTKCSEMDEELPLLLGVSKAILENVIFCHQEDSSWPLSDASSLKKRFDEIFEATRYTKALDNIKAIRKERTAELKVDKERLNFLKADKNKAERMRAELKKAIEEEQEKQEEVERLREKFEEIKQVNMQYYAEASGFQSKFQEAENLKIRKNMLEKNQQRTLEGMKEMTESTKELLEMIANFDQHLKSLEGRKMRLVESRDKEEASMEELRRRERNLASTQGGLIANRKIYERNLKERELAVREAAKIHNYAGYDYSPLEENKIVEFIDILHDLVRRAETEQKKVQMDGARKERDLQRELDRLAAARTETMATKKSKQDHIVKFNENIRTKEAQFESVSSVNVEVELLEGKLAEAEEVRARLENDISESRYDETIREKSLAIRQKETDRDKINAELAILNRQSDSRAQLSIKRNELQSKSSQVIASVASHSAKFKELVGTDLEAESMEEKITLSAGRRDRELVEAEAAASASNRTLSQLQTSINIAKSTLATKRDELRRLEQAIEAGLSESSKSTIEEAISEAEEELEYRQKNLLNADAMKEHWAKMLEVGKTKHKCLGCDRSLLASDEKAFEKYVQLQLKRFSTAGLKEMQEEEEGWKLELDKLRKLQPSELTVKELKEQIIPTLETQISDESKRLEKEQEEVEETKVRVGKAKLVVRDLQTLKNAASMISRILGETKDLENDVKRLERDLESSGSLKTVEEVQGEVERVTNEIKTLQREQQTLSSEKELKLNSLRSQQDDITRKTLRLNQLKGQQERREREEAALKELQDQVIALQAELKELDTAAQAADAPWREMNDTLSRHRVERQNAENDAGLNVGMYQSSLHELEGKHRACVTYVAEGNDRRMRENEAQIDEIKRDLISASETRSSLETQISKVQDELSRQGAVKSNINANITYREQAREIDKVQEDLEAIDLEQMAKSRREFNTKYSAKLEEETKVQNSWQRAQGLLVGINQNREKLEKTLEEDYKNVDRLFRDQLIKTKVSETANNDLEKYGKALDNAILRYHSIKMDEINSLLAHLWGIVYQGTDIDCIKIMSDHDEASSTSTRKSYNYRVVMVKNDVELDMRGRCSAGQKVLASIIIRLALAESFGQGCGVLALDEPTTNLDAENINSLAEALAEIIRERRRQANFQLVVITHDEAFLQRLAAHDVLEYYWRVSRDSNQNSVLERQRVSL